VRDEAIVLLNSLYDGVEWQLSISFNPVVKSVSQHFCIKSQLDFEGHKKTDQYYLVLMAPSSSNKSNKQVNSWHRVCIKKDSKEFILSMGKFWKCGFYDWRFVKINQKGQLKALDMIIKKEKEDIFDP
jgi:hypothetical protein